MWHDIIRHMAKRASTTTTAQLMSADVAELWSRIRTGQPQGHCYVALFGLRKYDAVHLVAQIRRGLPYSAFERFQRNTELPYALLTQFIAIPERTLARRKESGRLEPDESDRLVRASRVVARAIALFDGDAERARGWLTSSLHALGGRTPLEFATTDVGAIEVEHLVGRLEHGIPT